MEESQAKLGSKYIVTEVRPAKCVGELLDGPLVDATEVLFRYAKFGPRPEVG